MIRNIKNIMLPLVLLLSFFIFKEGCFIVTQIEQVVITRLGDPVRVIKKPGLHFKIPLIEKITFFDKRLMSIELSALEITLGDKRRVMVDAFGRYRITDPLKFYQTVYNEHGVLIRINPVVLGSLSSVLGKLSLSSMLSDMRIDAMNRIRDEVNKTAKSFGIDIIDVRIKKTDLPIQNTEAICNRMISERAREAKDIRARGIEMAQVIKSTADKENSIALSKTETEVQELLAAGDLEANKIYVDAFSKDKEFFEFSQFLEAYKESFQKENTSFVISPNGKFFKTMNGY